MLRQMQNGSKRPAALLAVGLLALALGGCSMFHRAKPGSDVGAEVKHPAGSHEPYPNLGSVPDRPKSSETADMRRDIARDLAADREAAHYTDQALRGGTEASAPPPPVPVPGLAAASDEAGAATGALGDAGGTKTAAAQEERPSFFGRLFHRSKAKAAAAEGPAPLPAQPTKPVDVTPAAPATP